MRIGGGPWTGWALAVGAVVGLGALSQVPYPWNLPDQAAIRLTWRVRSHRVEECRRVTAQELARQPPHMRREEICEGRLLPYRLRVSLDGRVIIEEDVEPAGARADRPLYVYREIPVAPGERLLELTFVRRDMGDAGPAAGDGGPRQAAVGDTAGHPAPSAQEAPPILRFERRLTLAPGEVALVTYDPDTRQLVTRGYGVVP